MAAMFLGHTYILPAIAPGVFHELLDEVSVYIIATLLKKGWLCSYHKSPPPDQMVGSGQPNLASLVSL